MVAVLGLLQLNCNGIVKKFDDIVSYMQKHQLHIGAFQETKLSKTSDIPPISGFTLIREDRDTDSGGGLAFLVDHRIQFDEVKIRNPDAHTELQRIRVKTGDRTWLNITNVYIPPVSSCATGFQPALQKALDGDDSLVLGDFNAHDPLWYSSLSDSRGLDVAALIARSNMTVMNEDSPTRLPKDRQPTSPDISLASPSICLSSSWSTAVALRSDHLPITIKVQLSEPIKASCLQRSYVNLAKANWPKFKEESEARFQRCTEPNDVMVAERTFREIVNSVSARCIPAGRVKTVLPGYPTSAAKLAEERDEIRKRDPSSPDIERINYEIQSQLTDHRITRWHGHLSTINRHTGLDKLWKTVKSIKNGPSHDPNRSIQFKK